MPLRLAVPITRAALEPMYAKLGHELPRAPGWTYEPKYDGMRVLAEVPGGLRAMRARLDRLERRSAPFAETPRTNEPAHWVAPKLVVEVKFAERTAVARLRQPNFLGLREEKAARHVTIEGVSLHRWGTGEIANDAP